MISANTAWEKLIDKYDIISQIHNNGHFEITAEQIKEYKEPRLMAKWDSSESLPAVFKQNHINILPISRGKYILGNFSLYKDIPPVAESNDIIYANVPIHYESVDINNITTEANAINVLGLSNILDDFLQEENNMATFNGRMGTNRFEFYVNERGGTQQLINVDRAQCEIDGGFENENSVVILEAKNVVHSDFHIRQLYYPLRLWETKVNKPVRVIFSVYSNKIYRMFEYEFSNLLDYSSIQLVQHKNYSLENTGISLDDIVDVYRSVTDNIQSDNRETATIPFIQANSFDKVISLLEHLYEEGKTVKEIARIMQFEERQSDYYYNAGAYLGIFEKDDHIIGLTMKGKSIYKMSYKSRQLALVKLIFTHQIFHDLFERFLACGQIPDKRFIEQEMRRLNVCTEKLIIRRSSSVLGWLKWILSLITM